MIRPANFADVPRLADLLVEAHSRSRYLGVCGVDLKYAKAMLVRSIQRHGGAHDGATCLFVAVKAGVVEGFVLGMMDRVYLIGDRLAAQDGLFYATDAVAARDPAALIDAYVGWAEASPDCIEIGLSATTVIAATARVERLFVRKGFERSGVIYRKAVRSAATIERIAA